MKVRKVVKYPDRRLRIVSFKDGNLHNVIEDMKATMAHNRGIGLAAIQIGVPAKVFIAFDTVFINPEIVEKSEEIYIAEEGCLSLPQKLYYKVNRHKKISIRYFNENKEQKLESYEGLEARIIQHEMDHLNGELVIDKQE